MPKNADDQPTPCSIGIFEAQDRLLDQLARLGEGARVVAVHSIVVIGEWVSVHLNTNRPELNGGLPLYVGFSRPRDCPPSVFDEAWAHRMLFPPDVPETFIA